MHVYKAMRVYYRKTAHCTDICTSNRCVIYLSFIIYRTVCQTTRMGLNLDNLCAQPSLPLPKHLLFYYLMYQPWSNTDVLAEKVIMGIGNI